MTSGVNIRATRQGRTLTRSDLAKADIENVAGRAVPPPESYSLSSARPAGKQIRVLHVLPFFACGGTELIVRRLVSSLGAPEFEHLICTMRGFDPEMVQASQLADRVVQAGSSEPGLQFPFLRLVAIMRRFRPDVVHTRNWGSLEAILAARAVGITATVHSEHGYEVDMIDGLPFRRRLVRKGLYSLTNVLFTVSRELREFHAQQARISAARIRVLYNGVDAERFAFRNESRAAARARFGFPADSVVVGSVGRMVAIKDYPLTLRSVSQLIQRGHNIRVLLVGAGPEFVPLKQMARDLVELTGRVHFCNFSDHVPELLNAMDIFVQASLAEGMSNTVLEAMATGLPVLATRVGGNMEVINDGETGCFFPPGDTAALTDCLDVLVNSAELRRQLGDAGRLRVLHEFSLDRMVDEYRKLYHELAASRRTNSGQPGRNL